MAIIFTDPNPAGPFASFQLKDVQVKAIRLTFSNFTTGGVNTLGAVLPADATILGADLWVKTALAGGGITAATISIGTASGGTQIVNANTGAAGTAGVQTKLSPINGILQAYNPPYTVDQNLWVNGTATTGNPTSGEMYVLVYFVR